MAAGPAFDAAAARRLPRAPAANSASRSHWAQSATRTRFAGTIQGDERGADTVEQVAVVGHQHHRTLELEQAASSTSSEDVEAVGRLEDEQVRLLAHQVGEQHARPLATGERSDREVELVGLEEEALARRRRDAAALVSIISPLGQSALRAVWDSRPGTRLGILGLNGSGKSTRYASSPGSWSRTVAVHHISGLRVEIFDQKRERLDPKILLRKALCPSGEMVVYQGRGIAPAAWAKRLFQPNQLDSRSDRSPVASRRACCSPTWCARRRTCSSGTSRPTTSTSPRSRCSRAACSSSAAAVVLVTY